MEGYAGGRIKKIKIRNFMTYDFVELKPQKGLNLIVGLNGSGKSSIMCAICLGLAGKPLFTGRATQLSDFIKHGCQEAEIEIELEKAKGSLSIRRKIKGDKCEWFLNNSGSSQTEVARTVQQFNIDTSNLCQFLPQEKVVEFSRMDKKQRLENMLQAIGEPRLFELFNELKNLYGSSDEILHEIKRYEANKSSAEEENERVSDEVHKQENRVRLKKELDEMFKQKKILNYQVIFDEVQQLKVTLKNVETELTTIREERKEAEALENSILTSYTKYSHQLQQFNSQKKDVTSKITTASSCLISLKEKVEYANIEYKNRLTEAEGQKKRFHDLNKQIEGLKQSVSEEKKKYEAYKEQYRSDPQEHFQLQQDLNFKYSKLEGLSAEENRIDYDIQQHNNKLSSLNNELNKKMDNLKRRDRFTFEAACWLQENRSTFKSNIYLPVMLEIKVQSSENCKYIESAIPFRDMIAFVCEDKSDCERFSDIMTQKRLPVNVVMAPETQPANFPSVPLTQAYRNCGLQCYVSDLFTAPEPVMRYLCSCYRLHCIPVATSPVNGNHINFILQKYKIFFSENFRVTGKRSRYGDKNWSERKDFIMNQNLLTIDNGELQNSVQQELQAKQEHKKAVEKQREELQSKCNDLERKLEKLRSDKKRIQDWEKNIVVQQRSYEQKLKLQSQISVIDVEEERLKAARKIKSINDHREKTLGELNQLLMEYVHIEKEVIKAILCMNALSKSLKLTIASNEEVHEKAKTAEMAHENVKKELKEKKHIGRILIEEVKAMGEEYVKYIEATDLVPLRLSAEEIEQKINHIQAQLNVDEDNEPLVAAYNARKERIEDYQMQISRLMCKLEELKEDVQEKKTQWLTPLQKHIANIDKKFSQYFKKLNCVGEISLDIPDNPDDFGKYGLQIKLKFRDEEPLTELSQTRHSGGECSVAAIVFILSLQELTEVPFRCIDEINQGMDSVNERKIYQLVADSVGEDRCSQYFLLTPKLLTDLEYPDDVAVHIIFNSSFLNIQLDVRKHLEIAPCV